MKNPFEIRAEILTLAAAHLKSQYEANLAFYHTMLTKIGDSLEFPKYPSVSDIIAEAKNLSKFVDKP